MRACFRLLECENGGSGVPVGLFVAINGSKTMQHRKTTSVGICLVLITAFQAIAQQGDIDWNRARQLRQRGIQGEKLTEDEQSYLQRAIELRQKQKPQQRRPDRYKGQDGGLYGGGNNEPPQEHLQAALQQAKLIQPLDADGKPSDNGKIVMISVGMSNTTQEFSAFVRLANADPAKSPKVVIVDGAQGGMDAKAWAVSGRPDQPGSRIAPGSIGEFPKHAEEMKGHMVTILNMLKERFPNLRLAYLSSRIYAGYAKSTLNPEPYAYESAFVVRWLIQDQIKGEPSLNYDPAKGTVKSPLLLWGPYLWADGEKGRKIDELVWKPEDLGPDGTHPSDNGRRKVAELLLDFVKTDSTAKAWFVQEGKR